MWTILKKGEHINTKDEKANEKGPPLVIAAWLLASIFTTAIHTNNNQPTNDTDKEEIYQDSLYKAILYTEEAMELL